MTRRWALEADCESCSGLCCVSLAFARGPGFSFSKPAHVPCRHLSSANRCSIHAARVERGLAGCVRYDCYGAGQRVTLELFPGRSWRDEPELAPQVFEAFRVLRDVHELALLLDAARRIELPGALAERRQQLARELEPDPGWTPESLFALDLAGACARVHAFLRELRPYAAALPLDTTPTCRTRAGTPAPSCASRAASAPPGSR
jgi:hypothetical protein